MVNAMSVVMVTVFCSRLFLPTGPSHRQGEVAERNARLSAKHGVCTENRKMLCREQHSPPRVDRETAHLAADAAGKAELASRIQQKKHALAHSIPLAGRPEPDPLRDRDLLTSTGPADRLLDMEADGNDLDRLRAAGRVTLYAGDSSRENRSSGAGELR